MGHPHDELSHKRVVQDSPLLAGDWEEQCCRPSGGGIWRATASARRGRPEEASSSWVHARWWEPAVATATTRLRGSLAGNACSGGEVGGGADEGTWGCSVSVMPRRARPGGTLYVRDAVDGF